MMDIILFFQEAAEVLGIVFYLLAGLTLFYTGLAIYLMVREHQQSKERKHLALWRDALAKETKAHWAHQQSLRNEGGSRR